MYLISMKKTEVQLYNGYFIIQDKTFSFWDLLWFNIEIDEKWNFMNFIITPISTGYPLKYTIFDSADNVKNFVTKVLELQVPLYDWYEKDKMYKIIKTLKLG